MLGKPHALFEKAGPRGPQRASAAEDYGRRNPHARAEDGAPVRGNPHAPVEKAGPRAPRRASAAEDYGTREPPCSRRRWRARSRATPMLWWRRSAERHPKDERIPMLSSRMGRPVRGNPHALVEKAGPGGGPNPHALVEVAKQSPRSGRKGGAAGGPAKSARGGRRWTEESPCSRRGWGTRRGAIPMLRYRRRAEKRRPARGNPHALLQWRAKRRRPARGNPHALLQAAGQKAAQRGAQGTG